MSKNLILDSHIVLWILNDDPKLSDHAWKTITTTQLVYVSAATCWELEIKKSLGKLDYSADLIQDVETAGFTWLPITPQHGRSAAQLPLHHRDPYDRMLIAQAACENLDVVSHDSTFAAYGITVIG